MWDTGAGATVAQEPKRVEKWDAATEAKLDKVPSANHRRVIRGPGRVRTYDQWIMSPLL